MSPIDPHSLDARSVDKLHGLIDLQEREETCQESEENMRCEGGIGKLPVSLSPPLQKIKNKLEMCVNVKEVRLMNAHTDTYYLSDLIEGLCMNEVRE